MMAVSVWIYNLGVGFYFVLIRIAAWLGNQKARKFIHGREGTLEYLEDKLSSNHRSRIWLHISSLGEYEQAKPVIVGLKEKFPNALIVLSFFSPSGYEHVVKQRGDDVIFYLPRDTKANARKLLDIIEPTMILFVKYDLWYHILHESSNRDIPTYLFSAVIRQDHIYLRWYGVLHRSMLRQMDMIFVEDNRSADALASIGIQSIVAGNTRVDSVIAMAHTPMSYPKIVEFKDDKPMLIIGSAWLEEISYIKPILARLLSKYQLLIAPHRIDKSYIDQIRHTLSGYDILLYCESIPIGNEQIMILDTIGMLKYAYRYASVAIVGGGMRKSGIHSILEPAAYGLPIFFGAIYDKFIEARILVEKGGAVVLDHDMRFLDMIMNDDQLMRMSAINQAYVEDSKGATARVLDYL